MDRRSSNSLLINTYEHDDDATKALIVTREKNQGQSNNQYKCSINNVHHRNKRN